MTRYSKSVSDLTEEFEAMGIPLEVPGFYDQPAFVATERRDPEFRPPHEAKGQVELHGRGTIMRRQEELFIGRSARYCYVRVRGAVLDVLRRLDPLSRHTRTQVTLVRRASVGLERELGRAPLTGEIAAVTGLSANGVAHRAVPKFPESSTHGRAVPPVLFRPV